MNSLKFDRIIYFLAIFSISFIIFVMRRPDIITNAQFWAEDGAIWYHQANILGPLQSLILPQQGYYQSISKLVASLSLLLPIYYAPLFFNIIGIAVRCWVVMFLLSKRLDMYSLPARFMIAAFLIFMPHLEEVHANITNAHWYLSMLLFMVLIAKKPATLSGKFHDVIVLIIAGFSGPFIVFMTPLLALKLVSNAPGEGIIDKALNAIKKIDWFSCLFIAFAGIQVMTILLSFDDSRIHTELGATLQLLINILSTRVFAGFALSDSAMLGLWHMKLVNDVVVILSISIIVFALFKSDWRTWSIVIYPFTMLFLALARPMISTEIPQWHGFEFPGSGQRYFVITGVFWFSILLIAASKLSGNLRIIAYVALMSVVAKVAVCDFKIQPLPDSHWDVQVERYNNSSKGDTVFMEINPPRWVMEIVK
ncbi:hypothetical protein PX092_00890 [Citrobacter freundii]|uniref:hypothetical protein n=1 Tax=Citrobacter freundii TaxID=546 RepID=UPI00292BF90E|nr:hypothetical protein [Citrobacter freundii]HEC1364810.1 hypothetical protein [Citrobacter freundii]